MAAKIVKPTSALRIGRDGEIRYGFPEESLVEDGIYRVVGGISWPDEASNGFVVLCMLEPKSGRAWIVEEKDWEVVDPGRQYKALADIYKDWHVAYLNLTYYADIQWRGLRIFQPQIGNSIHFAPPMNLCWASWVSEHEAIQAISQRAIDGRLTGTRGSMVDQGMAVNHARPEIVPPPLRALMGAVFGLNAAQRSYDDAKKMEKRERTEGTGRKNDREIQGLQCFFLIDSGRKGPNDSRSATASPLGIALPNRATASGNEAPAKETDHAGADDYPDSGPRVRFK